MTFSKNNGKFDGYGTVESITGPHDGIKSMDRKTHFLPNFDSWNPQNTISGIPIILFTVTTIVLVGAASVASIGYVGEEASTTTVSPSPAAKMVQDCMNTSASPCDDFYEYACGHWLDSHSIPSDANHVSRFYQGGEMGAANDLVSLDILANGTDPLLRPYFQSCMENYGNRNNQTLAPLSALLELVNTCCDPQSADKDEEQVSDIVPVFFALPRPADDLSTGKTNLLQFVQGGLPLPDPDYYLSDQHSDLRVQYRQHISRMFRLIQNRTADIVIPSNKPFDHEINMMTTTVGDAVLAFETNLAKISVKQTGDFLKSKEAYNPMSISALKKVTRLPFGDYLNFIGFNKDNNSNKKTNSDERINLVNPEFFKALRSVLLETDTVTIRAYLTWQIVHALAIALSTDLAYESWAFFGNILKGEKQPPSRSESCLDDVNEGGLGFVLGKEWVRQQFSNSTKIASEQMFETIRNTFIKNLKNLSWLDESTRNYASKKASDVVGQLGYPSPAWPTNPFFEELKLDCKSHLSNKMRIANATLRDLVARASSNVSALEWSITTGYDTLNPQTVSAFNAESPNFMIVPAGIIQSPLFGSEFPPALLYGGLAAVVGHEFTHSFDNIGRHFGTNGQLLDWWSDATDERFSERSQCFIEQYEQYPIDGVPGLRLNGSFVLQENIADNGGVRLAFNAYREAIGGRKGGSEPSIVEGLTNDQLFFVQFTQNWCFKMTPAYANYWVQNNQHSTPRNRARGCLSNMPEFSAAFKCPTGATWNPEKKCRLW